MAKRANKFQAGRPPMARPCPVLMALILALAACRNGANAPVAIAAEDMCAQCKMAISEKRFAAEFIIKDGQPFKFDDITCMTGYLKQKENRANIKAYFVMDFNTRQWVKAEAAYYLRSPQIKTPMNGGVVAFGDEAKLREAVASYQGESLGFNDLFDLEK